MDIRFQLLPHGGNKVNDPNRIIIHCMAQYIMDPDPVYAADFLDKYKLSAHVLVDPSGEVIICRVDDQRAWHARGHNTNTLGIEYLVEGEHTYATFLERIKTPYLSKLQYQAGLDVIRNWVQEFPIEKIERHSDISPGRKVDPGDGFPFSVLMNEVPFGG